MDPTNRLAQAVEHTLLSPTAVATDIDRLCREARTHGLGGVCVHPSWVRHCRDALGGQPVRVVTVVGFPLGANTAAVKAFECAQAIADGAHEVDMVVALGALKQRDLERLRDDVRQVVDAASGVPVKAILECGLLGDDEKALGAEAAVAAGVAFVKTCTGFSSGRATVADVRLLRRVVGGDIGIKASGGIRDKASALELLLAGADRIGTSAGVAIASRNHRKDEA